MGRCDASPEAVEVVPVAVAETRVAPEAVEDREDVEPTVALEEEKSWARVKVKRERRRVGRVREKCIVLFEDLEFGWFGIGDGCVASEGKVLLLL